jgi:hypothetical protein
VVVLQAAGADGRPRLAEVGDRAGTLAVRQVELLYDPDPPVLRLVDPRVPGSATVLLARPGGAAVTLLGTGAGGPARDGDGDGDGEADALPVDASGLRADERDLVGQRVAVLDRDGRLLGSGTVPPAAALTSTPDDQQLVAPLELDADPRPPRPRDLDDAARLASRLPGQGPLRVAVVELSGVGLGGNRVGVPRFYELEKGGRRWTASELVVDGQPTCTRVVPGGVGDAAVLQCPVPSARDGVIAIAPHRGLGLTGIRLGSSRWAFSPVSGQDGVLVSTGPNFPTGAGEVQLVDDAGTARPPLLVPAYEP